MSAAQQPPSSSSNMDINASTPSIPAKRSLALSGLSVAVNRTPIVLSPTPIVHAQQQPQPQEPSSVSSSSPDAPPVASPIIGPVASPVLAPLSLTPPPSIVSASPLSAPLIGPAPSLQLRAPTLQAPSGLRVPNLSMPIISPSKPAPLSAPSIGPAPAFSLQAPIIGAKPPAPLSNGLSIPRIGAQIGPAPSVSLSLKAPSIPPLSVHTPHHHVSLQPLQLPSAAAIPIIPLSSPPRSISPLLEPSHFHAPELSLTADIGTLDETGFHPAAKNSLPSLSSSDAVSSRTLQSICAFSTPATRVHVSSLASLIQSSPNPASSSASASSLSSPNVSSPPASLSSPPSSAPSSASSSSSASLFSPSQSSILSSPIPRWSSGIMAPPPPRKVIEEHEIVYRSSQDEAESPQQQQQPQQQIRWSDLEFTPRALGKGSFGTVKLAKHVPTQQLFAVKKLNLQNMMFSGAAGAEDRERRTRQAFSEIRVRDMSHPFIVSVFEAFYFHGTQEINIVLEYMDCGSLEDILSRAQSLGKTVPECVVADVCRQILQGLNYLHRTAHVIHRDFKLPNLLVNRKGQVKIADFGESKHVASTFASTATFAGTLTHMSPEKLSGKTYTVKDDIYSFGIAMGWLAMGKEPRPIDRSANAFELQMNVDEHPTIEVDTSKFSRELADFLFQCTRLDPESRPMAAELLQHAFIMTKANGSFSAWLEELMNTPIPAAQVPGYANFLNPKPAAPIR